MGQQTITFSNRDLYITNYKTIFCGADLHHYLCKKGKMIGWPFYRGRVKIVWLPCLRSVPELCICWVSKFVCLLNITFLKDNIKPLIYAYVARIQGNVCRIIITFLFLYLTLTLAGVQAKVLSFQKVLYRVIPRGIVVKP